MNKQNKPLANKYKWLLIATGLTLSTPALSEYYMAVDATYMDSKTLFGNGTTRFDLYPIRLKFGHRYEEFGWEIQALTPSDDTDTFPGGTPHEYELDYGVGAQITASSPGRGIYGGIGLTLIGSDYTVFSGGAPAVTSSSDTPFVTFNLGGQYEVNKNSRITFDYTFYHGDIECDFCIPNPNLPGGFINTDPDVRLSTYAIGYSYSF